MAAPHSVDPVQLLEQHLACVSPDLLREMIVSLANAMMSAQADQACGAGYGERSSERVNRRNGYPDPQVGHPGGEALVTVVATAYLLGVSTRRVERLAERLCCVV
jgi:putative transposase